MNYHNIGDGLRVVLWVAGCSHHCKGCQNPVTWNPDDGIEFDIRAKKEIFKELKKKHIAGITFSGGDPLFPQNRSEVFRLIKKIRKELPQKTIWLYTGYQWEQVRDLDGIEDIDVLIDGEFVQNLNDNNLHWIGSSNQRVINVKETLASGNVVLH